MRISNLTCLCVSGSLLFLLTSPCLAISLTSEDKILFVQGLSYGIDLANIALFNGIDEITVDSDLFVDSDTWDQSISTTYLGMPLQLTYAGNFDSVNNSATWNLTGSFSGFPIIGSGNASFVEDPISDLVTINWSQKGQINDPSKWTAGFGLTIPWGGNSKPKWNVSGSRESEQGDQFIDKVKVQVEFEELKPKKVTVEAEGDKKEGSQTVKIKPKVTVDLDKKETKVEVKAEIVDLEKIPEPTSTLGLLALGTLGAASTLKRKLKPSQSTKKETTKVG